MGLASQNPGAENKTGTFELQHLSQPVNQSQPWMDLGQQDGGRIL